MLSSSSELDSALSSEPTSAPTTTASSPVQETEPKPSEFRVVAYDPETGHLSEATTLSTLPSPLPGHETKTLQPHEVLPRLTHPAKFLARVEPLQEQGFEIVSGSGDILIFKRVRANPGSSGRYVWKDDRATDQELEEGLIAEQETSEQRREDWETPSAMLDAIPVEDASGQRKRMVNPIDGTVAAGNFASPTGFVNHDIVSFPPSSYPPSSYPSSSSPSEESTTPYAPLEPSSTVRREESVFSGSPRWEDGRVKDEGKQKEEPKKKGRVRRVAKRAFWVGVWVAGCSYAMSVVVEFMKHGGTGAGCSSPEYAEESERGG